MIQMEYLNAKSTECTVFIHGRTNKNVIYLPEEWEEFVDLLNITVHLTEVGAKQNLIIKRIQGLEVHLQTNGLPVNCHYMIIGNVLDKKFLE